MKRQYPMKIEDVTNLQTMLIYHEDLALKPYVCSEGKLTIGVGHRLDDDPPEIQKKLKKGLTKEQALDLLEEDIDLCQIDANKFPWFLKLDPVRQDIIIAMIFNMGYGSFKKFKRTIALIEDGFYPAASVEMLNSKWAKQVGSRAQHMSQLMLYGVYKEVFKGV